MSQAFSKFFFLLSFIFWLNWIQMELRMTMTMNDHHTITHHHHCPHPHQDEWGLEMCLQMHLKLLVSFFFSPSFIFWPNRFQTELRMMTMTTNGHYTPLSLPTATSGWTGRGSRCVMSCVTSMFFTYMSFLLY